MPCCYGNVLLPPFGCLLFYRSAFRALCTLCRMVWPTCSCRWTDCRSSMMCVQRLCAAISLQFRLKLLQALKAKLCQPQKPSSGGFLSHRTPSTVIRSVRALIVFNHPFAFLKKQISAIVPRRWSSGGITSRATQRRKAWGHPRQTPIPGWRAWSPTPTTWSRFGVTTRQDRGRPASATWSAPRKPVWVFAAALINEINEINKLK